MNIEPDFESAIGLIRHLSSDELKDMINDESKLINLLEDLPQMKFLQSERIRLLASNKSLADFNLSFEFKLSQNKDVICEKYEKISDFHDKINQMNQQIESSPTQQTPESIEKLLKEATSEREKETENLIQSFLNNEPSVDSFLNEFIPKRSNFHSRRTKSQKLHDIMKAHQKNGSEGSVTGINSSFVSTPWSTPYPTNLPNMPLPSFN